MPKHKQRGRLIVIEGTDGSGKQTQATLLYEKLTSMGYPCQQISFPEYGTPMCKPVECYLAGQLGKNKDVNPYAASLLYAIDRFGSYRMGSWREHYETGQIIIADRYVTSNMLHQGSKFNEPTQTECVKWIKDLEYRKLGLPKPSIIIYLHVNPDVSERLLRERKGKPGVQHDILESDIAYQRYCKQVALSIAKQEKWHVIDCTNGDNMLPIQEIHEKIMLEIQNILPSGGKIL